MNTQLNQPAGAGGATRQESSQLGERRAKSGLDESGSQEVVGSGEKLVTGVEISVVAGTWGDHMVEEIMLLEEVGLWREKPILNFFLYARRLHCINRRG